MNILFLSHTFIGSPYVVGSHHLARELSSQGHFILHVSHPKSFFHKLIGRTEDFKHSGQISTNLYQYVPEIFVPAKYLMRSHLDNYLSLIIQKKITQVMSELNLDYFDICYIDDPIFATVIDRLNIENTVYRPTDIYVEMEGGHVYSRYENKVINKCCCVIGTNENIVKHLEKRGFNNPFRFIDNGYDYNHFLRKIPYKRSNSAEKNILYVGSLDNRLDRSIMQECTLKNKDIKFHIYSPDDCSFVSDNIIYHGTANYNDLPELLGQYDALIMPFKDIVSNHGRSPMKFFEYASSTRPIIMPSFMNSHGLDGVFTYSDLGSLLDVIDNIDFDVCYEREKEILYKSSWSKKASELLEITKSFSQK